MSKAQCTAQIGMFIGFIKKSIGNERAYRHKHKSSLPPVRTKLASYAVLVQLVEYLLAKEKATSSSLVYRSSVRRFEIMHNHEKSFCQL